MVLGQALHDVHDELVVVVGEVDLLVDRSELELVRCYLVVASLHGDAESLSFYLEVAHEVRHALRNRSEVVVLELLVFGRSVTHERAAREHQVGASHVETLVNEEVFLLPAEVRVYFGYALVEVLAHIDSGFVDSVERLQKRSLVVECVARVRDENRRDTERGAHDEGWRSDVPSGVATSLERLTDAAVRERRCVRFLLCEVLARELFDDVARTLRTVVDEAVVLLGSAVGQWLEPVSVVHCAVVHSPSLHACCHTVGCLAVDEFALGDSFAYSFVHRALEVFLHCLVAKNKFPIEF